MASKSPFPGMDPYLEMYWGDTHTSLATYARDQLQKQLPEDLRARVEEHLVVESDDDDEASSGYVPDVRIVENTARPNRRPTIAVSATLVEPVIVSREVEPSTQRSVHIVDIRRGHRLVTAIEFLSPVNKVGTKGRSAYQKKQREIISAGANLVEIDLIRRGRYILAAPTKNVPGGFRSTYRICVVRFWQPKLAETYRLSLRERLPAVRIPLREADDDAVLDLQLLIDLAYENGGNDDTDYRTDPVPPLSPADAAWADALLREKGLRK